MTTQYVSYDDIEEGKPRITSYEDNGIRTTTTMTRLGADPTVKPKETVSVRTIQHPDSTETIKVTERKLPPIRYTETITRERVPQKVQITRNGPRTEVIHSVNIPPTVTEVQPITPRTVNIVRRERIIEEPNSTVYNPDQLSPTRVVVRRTPEPVTTVINEPTSYIQVQNPRTTRVVEVHNPSPALTTTKKTTIINDVAAHESLINDHRTLVNYQDDYYATRRLGRRTEWCGNCDGDCCGCDCFNGCCDITSCCQTNAAFRRNDVASYETRVIKNGRRIR